MSFLVDGRFDVRPLTDPVDRTAVVAHAKEHAGSRASRIITIVLWSLLVVLIGGFLVFMLADMMRTSGTGAPVIIAVVVGLVVVAGVIWFFWRRNQQARRYRLMHFADAHGLSYVGDINSPNQPGMIFDIGTGRLATDVLAGAVPRPVEFGNYTYTTGTGKTQQTHVWGYVSIGLAHRLPHIVLDARRNDFLGSNLPASFSRAQRLSLEGDFDKHFTLYAPEGYERDALYLFTPDVMARLIDKASALDIEIIDDRLYLYSKDPTVTLDPDRWQWLGGVIGALSGKLAQWERWRDDRLEPATPAPAVDGAAAAAPLAAPTGVAAPGARLKRGVPWGAIAGIVVVAAVWAWSVTGR